jgi:hypothetical protein
MRDLIGTWRLVDWTASVGDTVTKPFRGEADGLLVYAEDGWMFATLQRRDRTPLGTGTLAAGTAEQRAIAAAGYLSYAGTYAVNGDVVTHHVHFSLFPDWVGQDQVRHIAWLGDDLVLETPPEETVGGRLIVNRLRWRR